MQVSYGKSVHGVKEISAVTKVLKNSTQMGKQVELFEKRIAKVFDKKYGVMVNSGSSALFLIFQILNFKKNSEVITPALTFGTTMSAIVNNNLKPVLIDVEKNTFNIDVDRIERNISKKTKAICIPHLIGNISNLKKIRNLANKYKLFFIEDSADTLGSKYDGKSTGSFSDASITSFYGSHVINGAGNGGMLCINNYEIYKRAILLRSWGRSSSIFGKNSEKIENRFNVKLDKIDYDKKFIFQELGYNLEPSEISAAFANIQLNNLDKNSKIRKRNFNFHQKFFSKLDNFFEHPKVERYVDTNWLAYPFLIKKNNLFNRKKLQIYLEKNKIQTRVIFTGNITRQPCMRNVNYKVDKGGLINSDNVMKYGMMIGLHHGLNFKELKYIHDKILDLINQK